MGDILPDGTIGGYEGYCPNCNQVVKMNIQGNIIDGHKCKGDNNTAIIPQNILDKINDESQKGALREPQSFYEGAERMYQLRQPEVDELKKEIEICKACWKEEMTDRMQKEKQLKAANETIEELRKGGLRWVKASERLPVNYKKVAAKRNGWYGQLIADVYNVYFLKDTFDRKFPEMFSNIEWLDESADNLQSALIHEKKMRSKEADNYNKRIQELQAELRSVQKVH